MIDVSKCSPSMGFFSSSQLCGIRGRETLQRGAGWVGIVTKQPKPFKSNYVINPCSQGLQIPSGFDSIKINMVSYEARQ